MTDNPADVTPEPAAEGDHIGRKRIGLAAVAIMLIHFLAKIGGFIQKKVLAHFFGTGVMADAGAGMERIFSLIYYIPEELLTHSLLPVFTSTRDKEGEAAAWRMASLTGTIHALALIVVSLLCVCFPESLVGFFLKDWGNEPEKFQMTVEVVRVAMLGLFCTSLGSLTYVLLNAYKRFVTPALGDVAQKAGIVLGTVIVVVGFGHHHPLGYAVGFILGGVFKLLTHLIALGPKLKLARPGFDFKNPHLRELGLLMIPLLAGTIASKLRDWAELNIIAKVPVDGTLASIDYAKKLVLTPVQILPYALGIALFPFLAEWAAKRDKERVTEAFLGASKMMIFIFLPLTALFLMVGNEIITVLYKSGKFTDASTALTMGPFALFSVAMVFYALEIIAMQIYYAHKDTSTPFVLGLIGSGLQVLLDWVAAVALGLGNIGIAAAYAVSKTVKVVLMWWKLSPRLTGYGWGSLAALVGKTALATGGMAGFIYAARPLAATALDLTSVKGAFVFLGGVSLGGGVIFLALAALLRIDELQLLRGAVRRKLKKK